METATGDDLYAIVEHYAWLGIHRAGTSVDDSTAAWMAEELIARGLDVTLEPVPFQRFVVTSRLTADGADIEHLPVHHEWTGALATDRVHVAAFDPRSGGFPDALVEPIEAARAAGAHAAVLATTHPEGALVGINRVIGAGSGFPTVLVAGRDLDRLTAGAVRLAIEARLEPGATTNVVGHTLGSVAGNEPPLLLTTPLTGWFTCAGERGTGIAVLLHLVDRFRNRPVVVVATGGHELDYFGVRHWVEHAVGRSAGTPVAVVHVGASVAVDAPTGDGRRELVPTRLAMTDVAADPAAPMAEALAAIGLTLVTDTERWIGESEVFCELGVPMLSFTGSGIDFHTPDDTPERATSPDSLARVARAIGDAADALDTFTRSSP